MSERVIELTQAQVNFLVPLASARDQAAQTHDIAFTAILAGHDITTASGYTLDGTTMTVHIPDGA